jgi:hypothetical protein
MAGTIRGVVMFEVPEGYAFEELMYALDGYQLKFYKAYIGIFLETERNREALEDFLTTILKRVKAEEPAQ